MRLRDIFSFYSFCFNIIWEKHIFSFPDGHLRRKRDVPFPPGFPPGPLPEIPFPEIPYPEIPPFLPYDRQCFCPPGPRGIRGYKGEKGDMGPVGEGDMAGMSGARGPPGLKGVTGIFSLRPVFKV